MGVKKSYTRLDGYLGKDPEFKELENGSKVVKFNVGTQESIKQPDGEWKTETEWHRCVAWGKNAERINEKLKQGDRVAIEGKNKTRSWENDGHKFFRTEVKVDLWEKISKTTVSKTTLPEDQEEDDLPF